MSDGYSRSPRLLKGALIQIDAPFFVPIPNVIVFQYNPESLSRTLTPWSRLEIDDPESLTDEQRQTLAQPWDPTETFSVTLELDATDALEHPESHPVAMISGVADRIAAIEMLMYPPDDSAIGDLLGDIGAAVGLGGGGEVDILPRLDVPVVLFFWGPGRIVPVRITSLSVDEQAFSPVLYPIRASASIGLQVLTPQSFDSNSDSIAVEIARASYTFTRVQKEALALANLANSVESIIGMLPL